MGFLGIRTSGPLFPIPSRALFLVSVLSNSKVLTFVLPYFIFLKKERKCNEYSSAEEVVNTRPEGPECNTNIRANTPVRFDSPSAVEEDRQVPGSSWPSSLGKPARTISKFSKQTLNNYTHVKAHTNAHAFTHMHTQCTHTKTHTACTHATEMIKSLNNYLLSVYCLLGSSLQIEGP